MTVKHILKYLWRMKDYMLVYYCDELLPLRYTDLDFQSNKHSHKSTSRFLFTPSGRVVNWRSVKQSCIIDSTMEVKYCYF